MNRPSITVRSKADRQPVSAASLLDNDAIVQALIEHPSVTKAAKALDVPRSTLQFEMQKRGIAIRRMPVIQPLHLNRHLNRIGA